MRIDGLRLMAGGGLRLELDESRRGAELPSNASYGDLFQTEDSPTAFGGIYEYVVPGKWVLRNPQSQLMTYDISGTVFGTPEPSDKVLMFAPARTFKILAHESCVTGVSLMAPQWDHDFEIVVQRDGQLQGVGYLRFAEGSQVGEFIPSESVFEVRRGDMLVVFAPYDIDQQFADISITISGILSI